MKPKPDEIEVSVFGPGFGECIVIHIGSGKWAIIDSCIAGGEEPASLVYLQELGVSLETDIISVSASHWHDDHVRGLAKTVEACKAAKLSFGAAFNSEEFIAYLMANDTKLLKRLGKGGTELLNCLEIINQTGRKAKAVLENTVIFDCDHGFLDHGQRVELRALSPTNKQYGGFLKLIGSQIPVREWKPRAKIKDPSRNSLSIAMLLTIGEQGVLLGADLEQENDPQLGWNAIVENRAGRRPRSHIFKIPHHGSHSAHNEEVWRGLVTKTPWSIVTPWLLGGKSLPKASDIQRLKSFTNKCYITSTNIPALKERYGNDFGQIGKSGKDLNTSISSRGRVTLRWSAKEKKPNVNVELINGAENLFAVKSTSGKVH